MATSAAPPAPTAPSVGKKPTKPPPSPAPPASPPKNPPTANPPRAPPTPAPPAAPFYSDNRRNCATGSLARRCSGEREPQRRKDRKGIERQSKFLLSRIFLRDLCAFAVNTSSLLPPRPLAAPNPPSNKS